VNCVSLRDDFGRENAYFWRFGLNMFKFFNKKARLDATDYRKIATRCCFSSDWLNRIAFVNTVLML
jgi:hypothetical protein